MIFDIDQEQRDALTDAFAAGEQRGRERSDQDLVDLMVELRVKQARECAAAYREGQEVGVFLSILGVATILVFGLVTWWIW